MERLLDKKRLFERGRLLDHLRHTKIECQLIWVAQTHEQGSDKNIRSFYGYVTLSTLTYTEANQARGWYSFAVVCLEREGLEGYKDKDI